MQERRRSNVQRTEATRAALIAAARSLFAERGYTDTGTPELVAAAGVTRGALYHHFADKQDLFRAVLEDESRAVATQIERAGDEGDPMEALVAGAQAFVGAMIAGGRVRLLLLDGPAVLGPAAMDEIDGRHARRTLRDGLAAAIACGAVRDLPLGALTRQLSAAFDRAALSVAAGADPQEELAVLRALITGLAPVRSLHDEALQS